jgi:group I intron endonuclease
MFGIYSIRNTIDGKIYIGSTLGSFKQRFNSHKSALRHNKHGNPHLQRVWNKYGEDSFEFNIIEAIESPADVITAEQFYLDVFYGDMCYNIRAVAESNKGIIRSQETKRKHSITMKLRYGKDSKVAKDRSNRMKGVPQPEKASIARAMKIKTWPGFISPNGDEYTCIEDLVSFANEQSLNAQGLRRLGRNERKHYKGWRNVI